MGLAEMVVASIATTALNLSWVVPIDSGEKILGYVLHGISDDGDPIDVALAPDAQVFTPASRERRSLAATAAADASATRRANPDPEQLAPFTPLSYIVGGLAEGRATCSTCRRATRSARRTSPCVCAPPLCDDAVEGCVSTPLPAHTYDVPSAPDAPRELITDDFAVEARKAYEMFIELTPPFDHGLPLLGCELEFSNATYALAPDATGFNVSGLAPATQYGVRARSSNSLGWGAGRTSASSRRSRCRQDAGAALRRGADGATSSASTCSRRRVRPADHAVRGADRGGLKVELPTVSTRW